MNVTMEIYLILIFKCKPNKLMVTFIQENMCYIRRANIIGGNMTHVLMHMITRARLQHFFHKLVNNGIWNIYFMFMAIIF